MQNDKVGPKTKKSTQGRKPPRKVDAASLERSAIYYLERFSSSTANVRRLLLSKVDDSVKAHDSDREEAIGWVDALLVKLQEQGYLDDGRYAVTRALGLNRKGRSASTIRMDLRARGVDQQFVVAALDTLGEEFADPEFVAAVALARRRRLGPFRSPEQRTDLRAGDLHARDLRAKDLMVLARAGFAFEMARKVIDAESAEALDQIGD